MMSTPLPAEAADMIVYDASADIDKIASMVDFVFCAVDMKRKKSALWRKPTRKPSARSCPTTARIAARRMFP